MECDWVQGALHVRTDKRAAGLTLEDFLRQNLQLPEAFVRKLFARALIRVGKQVGERDQSLSAGIKIILQDPTPVKADSTLADLSPEILYEDHHVLVVNKPAGQIVHSDTKGEQTLDDAVRSYYRQSGQALPVLHVHRLDKPTTGAVVYAKHGFMARALDMALSTHQLERRYLAVAYGLKLSHQQVVEFPIGRDRHRAGLYRVSSTGKPARTYVDVQAGSRMEGQQLSLVECRLATGRTHQIRVHLSCLGAPILGDVSYGGREAVEGWPPVGAIALHARQVSFVHPYTEEKLIVNAPVGEDWSSFLRQQWSIEDVSQRI